MTGSKKPVIYNNLIQYFDPYFFILLFIFLGTILLSPKRIINNNIFSWQFLTGSKYWIKLLYITGFYVPRANYNCVCVCVGAMCRQSVLDHCARGRSPNPSGNSVPVWLGERARDRSGDQGTSLIRGRGSIRGAGLGGDQGTTKLLNKSSLFLFIYFGDFLP